jgi:DNA mismatch repair protein MutS
VVEAHLPRGEFIPNDLALGLDSGESIYFALITGPNMAGKSTYLRQGALMVLMAQIGSFVPAAEAKIGIADRIFCRVGASDNLARGESTFLVEMNETARILHTATEKSLVIMDEVGRGTGTADGLAIAWAVCEDLLDRIRCRTLFATHYHELSLLSRPHLANRSMEVLEENGEITFLRKLGEGPTAESYGIHVAALAGLPGGVLARAEAMLRRIKEGGRSIKGIFSSNKSAIRAPPSAQNDGLSPQHSEQLKIMIGNITNLDINKITPLEALNYLQRLKLDILSDPLSGRPPPGEQQRANRLKLSGNRRRDFPVQEEPDLFNDRRE